MQQLERIKQAEEILGTIWDEMRQGYFDEDDHNMLQEAVVCQIQINRIVFRLNFEMEKKIREESKNKTGG